MPALNLLIKPASSLCNMACKYCFYRDVADNRNTKSFGIMSMATVDAMLKNVFSYADSMVSFAFQGGEPTLAGEDYFRFFHACIEKYNTKKLPVAFSLQTNGYDISDGLIEIFSKYRYLLGVSLDGTRSLHNLLRTTASGGETYDKIKDTLRRLESRGVDYNILTVITENVASGGSGVYKNLREAGYRFLQFIPLVTDFGKENESAPYMLTNRSYAKFLIETFREYRQDFLDGRYVSVRDFDNFVRIAAGFPAECCGMGGRCYSNLVVEADGSVYPCDFYVLDEWRMGNIATDSIADMLSSDTALGFVEASLEIYEDCRACPYLPICKGGCRRHRQNASGAIAQNRYCEAYKEFFKECGYMISDIARSLCKK